MKINFISEERKVQYEGLNLRNFLPERKGGKDNVS